MTRPSTTRRLRRATRRTTSLAAAARWSALAYPVPAAWVVRQRRRLGLPRPVSVALAYGAPLATAAGLPPGRLRAAVVWAAHMWAYKVAFETPYDRPAHLRHRLHIDEPIAADRFIGAGEPPGARMQRRWRRPPRLSWLDRLLTLAYLVWTVEPHAALGWILVNDGDRFPLAALRLGATFDATLLGYYLVPTAPPWWASEREERMNTTVRRVTMEVMNEVRGHPRPGIDHSAGANPWAAFPSDHFASALMTAAVLADSSRSGALLAGLYAAALGVSLVYTGEHYVIDLLAGAALAGSIYYSAPRALPLAQRAAAALTSRHR